MCIYVFNICCRTADVIWLHNSPLKQKTSAFMSIFRRDGLNIETETGNVLKNVLFSLIDFYDC